MGAITGCFYAVSLRWKLPATFAFDKCAGESHRRELDRFRYSAHFDFAQVSFLTATAMPASIALAAITTPRRRLHILLFISQSLIDFALESVAGKAMQLRVI